MMQKRTFTSHAVSAFTPKAGAVLLSGITLSTLLTGCHGSKGLAEFTVPEEFDTSRNYEITFWAKNDTNKVQSAIYQKAIDDFQALYPNINVSLRLYSNYNDIYNDVITNISTNTTPNVCITYPDHIATYMTGSNVVVPLEGLFDDERYGLGGSEVLFDSVKHDEIVEKYLEEGNFCDRYYAIPYMRSSEVCYINKDMVEALGYTLPEQLSWDFIWEVSEKAMAQDSEGTFLVNGQKVMIPFIYKSTDNMMIQYLEQAGAEYSTDAGDILLFNDTTTDFLYEIADHAETGAFSTFKISSYPGNFLNAGQCIFAIDSTAGSTWMGSDAPLSDICEGNIVPFEIAVMPIPQVDASNPRMISQGPSICLFNKNDNQEVLASWLFAQYLLTNDVQIAYAETEGYVPVTTKAQQDPEYLKYLASGGIDNDLYYDVKIKATQILIDNIDNTFVTPVFNGSASLRNASGQLIEEVTKARRRHKTVDAAYIDKLYDDMTSLYRLDQVSAGTSGKAELGALPPTAVVLLVCLAVAWLAIGSYWGYNQYKLRKKHKEC